MVVLGRVRVVWVVRMVVSRVLREVDGAVESCAVVRERERVWAMCSV
jgi:hypothetical protein